MFFVSIFCQFTVYLMFMNTKLMHSFEYVNIITLFCRNTLENINGYIYSGGALTWCI